MRLYGLALRDFSNGDDNATLTIHRDDGSVTHLPASTFFRHSTELSIDKMALSHCRGCVLDVGAGSGLHSLHLQHQGLSVCAVDISPEACEVMRTHGVKNVHCVDMMNLVMSPFDTVLILGRGIGMVENLSGLDQFLQGIHRLVKHDGQILLNSLDVGRTINPTDLAYQESNRQADHYFGEVRLFFEYRGDKGPTFTFLYVDSKTLSHHSSKAGWQCKILTLEENGNYLARLKH